MHAFEVPKMHTSQWRQHFYMLVLTIQFLTKVGCFLNSYHIYEVFMYCLDAPVGSSIGLLYVPV